MQVREPTNTTLYDRCIALKQWAANNRVYTTVVPPEGKDDLRDREANTAFTVDQQTVLRKKGLTAVGMSEARDAIVLYTNGQISQAEKAKLPEKLFDDAALYFRKASTYTLKDEIEDLQVGLEPGRFHKERYACGSSISIANRRSAGTLGCIVKDNNDSLFGLTNNHVTGGCNNTRIGMQVLAPGVRDVTINTFDPFAIGYHQAVGTMLQGELEPERVTRNTDAAIFRLKDASIISSMQGEHYDTPSEIGEFIADPEEGTRVKKVGRTTDLTRGFIESRIVGVFPLNYDITTYHNAHESVRFVGKVYYEPVFVVRGYDASPFSSPGDSGSLVVTDEAEPKAVGLIFSGNTREKLSYMLPLKPTLDALEVELVSGHGV